MDRPGGAVRAYRVHLGSRACKLQTYKLPIINPHNVLFTKPVNVPCCYVILSEYAPGTVSTR